MVGLRTGYGLLKCLKSSATQCCLKIEVNMSAATSIPKVDIHHERLERLAGIQGSDCGVFVMCVHSFIEGWLREHFGVGNADVKFKDIVQRFIDEEKGARHGNVPGLPSLDALIMTHWDTGQVRHHFKALPRSMAEAATEQLEAFCRLVSVGRPEVMGTIRNYIAAWDSRIPMGALLRENTQIKELVRKEAAENRSLANQVADLARKIAAVEDLEVSILAKDKKISELQKSSDTRKERIDELRHERAAQEIELKDASKKLQEFEAAQEYVDIQRRMTIFTRSRADYERLIVRLSPEQIRVLEQIHMSNDFLIKGAAGTGKTLVLLKAIEKANKKDELGFEGFKGSIALLTYTRTLVKYDSYIAAILTGDDVADRVTTVEKFIAQRLPAARPGAKIEFDLTQRLCARHTIDGYSTKELANEIEHYLWDNDVSREDYVEKVKDRTGMKKRIPGEHRSLIWDAAEAVAAEMEAANTYSKARSRIKLLQVMGSNPAGLEPHRLDYLFIDEVQDLPVVDVKVLKAFTRRYVILAGDSDQSIFQPGFTFAKAGINIGGRSRILKTNFRNTIQLHEVAERFRTKIPGQDAENMPSAFRDGPVPELFLAKDRASLIDALDARLVFFVQHLGYSLENICVLFPNNDDGEAIRDRLEAKGIKVSDIRDEGFAFESETGLRLCTYKSVKGLDFPVVLMFLNRPPFIDDQHDEGAVEKMTRSLIYVGMTRAMEHLNVLAYEQSSSAAIQDLKACLSSTV